MRYKNLIGFVWVAVFMSLFTSCLKDINNVYNPGTTAAVVRQHGDSALMMANTRFGWIYSTKLSSYSEGKCLLVSFDYDPSLPENTNAEQKGYYTVTIQGETAVNQQNAESPLTDTHKLLTNEQPVLAVNPNDSVLYNVCTKVPIANEYCLPHRPSGLIKAAHTAYALHLQVCHCL